MNHPTTNISVPGDVAITLTFERDASPALTSIEMLPEPHTRDHGGYLALVDDAIIRLMTYRAEYVAAMQEEEMSQVG